MANELLILRHAKSSWDAGAPSDYLRPLAKRGRETAPRVGRWLAQQGLIPDHVVSSPAERARQTVLAVCRELGIGADRVDWDERIYGGGTRSLIDVLQECPSQAQRVLLAGHNPGLEDLVRALCAEDVPTPIDRKLLPTAAVARLGINVPWDELRRGCGHLVSLTRARPLAD